MRYARPLLSSFLLATVVVPAFANGGPQVANSNAITASRLYAHLQFVSSDEMEGRDTPSRGLNATAKYIASQLMQWGLKPMGDDGTFFQKIPLKSPIVDVSGTSATLGGTSLKYGDLYYASATNGSASGQVVFLPSAYEKKDDPASPYSKVDVKGKIILSVNARPDGVTFRDIRSGAVLSPQAAAQKHGAVGVILVAKDVSDWDSAAQLSTTGGSPRAPAGAVTTAPADPPSIIVKPEALAGLLQGEAMSVDDLKTRLSGASMGDAFALSNSKTASFAVAVNDNIVYTQNVVGEVEGRDSNLKNEFVAVGAHMDHLGMRKIGTGDLIFNGADDDGSGTVSILEIAHAFSEGPKPKRSIIFVWHCGEEKGLWGSGYFTDHPTVPITSIVAQLNIDMIGRSKKDGDTNPANKVLTGPGAIYLVGTTRMSSELGAEAKDVNKQMYNLTYDFTYDDLNNPERIFFRSDHYNYAKHGIPVLFWFDGVHEDYHKVSDEIAKIDFQKMEKVARTVYATAWDVANRKSRPKVDMPLPADISR
jgi:hypothetical protein